MWRVCNTGLQGDTLIPPKPVLNFNQERIWNSRTGSGFQGRRGSSGLGQPGSPCCRPHRTVLEGKLNHESEMINSDKCSRGSMNYSWMETSSNHAFFYSKPLEGVKEPTLCWLPHLPSPTPWVQGPNQNLTSPLGGWFQQDMSPAGRPFFLTLHSLIPTLTLSQL